MRSEPFYPIEKMRLLSCEKKALMMGLLLPEKVNGKKCGNLCREISFIVKSWLHVKIKRES